MDLTPEERSRIYEEEKARREAQRQLSLEWEEKRTTPPSQVVPKGCGIGCIALVVIIFLLAIVAAIQKGGGGGSQGGNEPSVGKSDAWSMAERFVKESLRSPGTADFGGLFGGDFQDPAACVTVLGGGRFRCRGWVDSQNSFGATVRTYFDLVLRYRSGRSWTLEAIEMTPR